MTDEAAPAVEVLSKVELFATALPALAGSDQAGFERTAYKGLTGSSFRTTVIDVPAGQGSTPRRSTFDHVLMLLSGSLNFRIDDKRYDIDEWGQILVPTGVNWNYANETDRPAIFLSVVAHTNPL